jgi:peptide deformylase
MIRKIVTYPDPILRKTAAPVGKVDDEIRSLLDDMAETMYADEGVGLAAPQVGVGLRAVVIDVGSEGPGLLKMVNPEVVKQEGEIRWEEGCLSVPDLRVVVKRHERIAVRYLDQDGVHRELEARGLLAVAVQHEIDHLDGRLIIDNISRLKQDMYLRKRKKLAEEKEKRPLAF